MQENILQDSGSVFGPNMAIRSGATQGNRNSSPNKWIRPGKTGHLVS